MSRGDCVVGYAVWTQLDRSGVELGIWSLGDGQYAIKRGGSLLPARWDVGDFIDCSRAYVRMLGVPLEPGLRGGDVDRATTSHASASSVH